MSAQPALAAEAQPDAHDDRAEAPPRLIAELVRKHKPPANLHNLAKTKRSRISRGGLKEAIEPNWRLMAPVYILASVLMGGISLSLPGTSTSLMLSTATIIAALTRKAAWLERTRLSTPSHRAALAAAVCGLPMLLFGLGIGRWAEFSGARWADSIGILVIVGALATIILNRKIASIITSQVALWLGVAMATGSRGAFLALAAGVAVAIYTTVRQARTDRDAEFKDNERQRTQLRAEEILHDFEQTGQGWFWETDRRGHLVYISPPIGEVLGRHSDSLLGRSISELFDENQLGQENERTLSFHLSARSAFGDVALRAAAKGEERWWSISGRPLYDTFGNFLGFRGSGNDLTEKRRSQENASRLAHYDSLTGLANRLQTSQTLEKILAAPNLDHRACAVFLLDLDRFKQVNDTMGHPAGDTLLTQVASRLERTVGQYGREIGRAHV